MLSRYVLADLVRNPRRTLSTMVGVSLGVGLFCGVLFFIDGLSASMTERAVAPLSIHMQRIVTTRTGATVALTQTFAPSGPIATGEQTRVILDVTNTGDVAANEVIVRSLPAAELTYVDGSAESDGARITAPTGDSDHPLAHGAGRTGLNIGTLEPGETRTICFVLEARTRVDIDDDTVETTYSTRESVAPT